MKRTPLKPRSEKRINYELELAGAKALVMNRCGGICEVCHVAEATSAHHRLRRSQGGTNDLDNLLGVCAEDHDLIHANPAYSYEQGWLLRMGGQPWT
jgi:hypothetical protein